MRKPNLFSWAVLLCIILASPFVFRFAASGIKSYLANPAIVTVASAKDTLDSNRLPETPMNYPEHPGFPIDLGLWSEKSSPVIADINNDGSGDILVATYGSDKEAASKTTGKIFAWNSSGESLPGFPIDTGGNLRGNFALADLDKNGTLEIAAGVESFSKGVGVQVYVWKSDGTTFSGWPKSTSCTRSDLWCSIMSVVLADMDGDANLDVVAATDAGTGTEPDPNLTFPAVYVWNRSGQLLPGKWPVADELDVKIVGAIAVGDLSGDGLPDVIFGRDYNRLFAMDNHGNNLPGWPIYVFWPTDRDNWDDDQIEFARSGATLADLNGDGTLEYIIDGLRRPSDEVIYSHPELLIYRPDGKRWRNWQEPAQGSQVIGQMTWRMLEAPAIADINSDGKLDIIITTQDGWVRAYSYDKQLLWQTNYGQGKFYATEVVIGDVDGDTRPEVIFGTFDPNFENAGPVGLWVLEDDGSIKANTPIAVKGSGIFGAPTLGDLDGDGMIEIAAITINGEVMVWDAPGAYTASRLPWPMARHDLQRTALYTDMAPNFSLSNKTASLRRAMTGDKVSFTIHLLRTGSNLSDPLGLTDVIPSGLSYLPGSLTATTGQVDDSRAPTLQWTGTMSNVTAVDITYSARVTQTTQGEITNTAVLDAGTYGSYSLRHTLVVNNMNLNLPFIR